jgi:superfamily II DNA or RNA helicase
MFSARYFQELAAERAALELSKNDKTTVVMCCGSGKTFTSALVADKVQAKLVVLQAPTIMLVNQIAAEYRAYTSRSVFEYHSERPDIDFILSGLTDSAAIITTYNSAPELLDKLTDVGAPVDLLIYDEAHRTAGKFQSLFNQTLDGYPLVQKRLSMTATPRHAALNENDDDAEFFSMDNVNLYGNISYSYQIRDAINDDVISDYKLLVACVTDKEVRDYLRDKTVSTSDHKTYALAMSLRRAMEQFGLKKVITYHATIAEASKAARVFAEVLDIPVAHVSSKQGKYTREANFSTYKNSDACIITNARSLNEGMNVPDTDAVMFCSIKSSVIDIIQCAGRAMRKHPGKEFGYIILPVLSGENALEHSDYSTILSVLNSISENDELLHQAIKLHMPDTEGRNNTLLPAFFRFTDDTSFDIKKLEANIYLKIYDSFNRSFFDRVEQLREFIKLNGNSRVLTAESGSFGIWVRHMRHLYATNSLPPEKVEILDSLGFIWDVKKEIFDANISELKKFLSEGHSVEEASTGPFLSFLKARREAFRKGTLPEYQKNELESLGVYFDPASHFLEENIRKLRDEVTIDGKVPKNSPLVSWVKYIRKKYKAKELPEDVAKRIEGAGLKLSTHSDREAVFTEKLSKLVDALRENKPLSNELMSFRGTIRRRYKSSTLEEQRLTEIRRYEEDFSIRII